MYLLKVFVPIHVFGILSIFKVRKGKGDGGPDGMSSMETYAMCKKMASGNVLFDLGSSDQCSVTSWRGQEVGGSKGKGACVYLWPVCIDVCQTRTQYCKAVILQLIIIKLKKVKSYLILIYCIYFAYI